MDESFQRILSSYKQGLLKQILDIDRQFIDEIKIVCPLCKTNKKKKEYKNAIFLEGKHGYVYHCCKCMSEGKDKKSITLNQYLKRSGKDAEGHALARWKIRSTGHGFNCPNPPDAKPDYLLQRIGNTGTADPKKAAEIYKRQAQQRKEENYRKKYGKEL